MNHFVMAPKCAKLPRSIVRQNALLQRAVQAEWRKLAAAWNARPPEAAAVTSHGDYHAQEMAWLANDMAQERRWKIAMARVLAHAAAAFDTKKLRVVKQPGERAATTKAANAQRAELASLRHQAGAWRANGTGSKDGL